MLKQKLFHTTEWTSVTEQNQNQMMKDLFEKALLMVWYEKLRQWAEYSNVP